MGEPTWQEITAEAIRRKAQALEDGRGDIELEALIVEITREGWKPPPAVDPDILAWREWVATSPYRADDALCQAYLAGARMARKQERDRASEMAGYLQAETLLKDGQGDHAREVLARYFGEA